MSLRNAAQYLAAHGRGADTTLMHVAPDEVARLQRAAQERGGSLSINPHTGLPEADFFSDLNPVHILKGEGAIGESGLGPALAGLALNYFAPGAGEALGLSGAGGLGLSNAAATGVMVGGASAALNGSLQKGLMAGLGAYGASGLGEAAMGGVNAAEAARAAASVEESALQHLPGSTAVAAPPMSMADTLKAGAKGISGLGTKDLLMKGLAAAAPIAAAQANKKMDAPASNAQGYIRQYYFDPKTQTVKPLEPVAAKDWGNRTFESRVPYLPQSQAANGGLQSSYAMGGVTDGMADGGPMMGSGSAFDFQQRSEPVVRMADGGSTDDTKAPPTPQSLEDQARLAPNLYFQARPDVAEAYKLDSYGMTPAEFATAHYKNYGQYEQPNAPATPQSQEAPTYYGGSLFGFEKAPVAPATPQFNPTDYGPSKPSDYVAPGPGVPVSKLSDMPGAGPVPLFEDIPGEGALSRLKRKLNAINAGGGSGGGGSNNQDKNKLINMGIGAAASHFIPGFDYANAGAKFISGDIPGAATSLVSGLTGGISSLFANGGKVRGYADGGAPEFGEASAPAAPASPASVNPYFVANQDVAKAYAENSYGMTPEQYAQTHYDKYGAAEQRISPIENISYANPYLLANQDVAADYAKNSYGMTPQQLAEFHYDKYGKPEGRDTILEAANNTVANLYRNALGRDPDPGGLQYWSGRLMKGDNEADVYKDMLYGAKQNAELGNYGLSLSQANKAYSGYKSADQRNIADEWVRNVLGREVTDSDRQQQWYKDATSATANSSVDAAKNIYGQFQNYATSVGADTIAQKTALARQTIAAKGLTDDDVLKQTGKSLAQLIGAPKTDLDIWHASQLLKPSDSPFDFTSLKGRDVTTPQTYAPTGTKNPYGNPMTPGDITINPDNTRTVTPNIPGRPYGGFTGMDQVKNAYTQGGGSLGQILRPTQAYQNTGLSADIYKYLSGKGAYPVQATGIGNNSRYYNNVAPSTTNIGAKNWINPKTGVYEPNPNYVDPAKAAAAVNTGSIDSVDSSNPVGGANGGLMAAMARGGSTHQPFFSKSTGKFNYSGPKVYAAGGDTGYNLGGYSDGGRLLRGPGDGVSDSIPATIGHKQPARLADGEFVVPARIVSELGNGSTEAGARKLYAMMERVQQARGKTVGKGKIAKNSRADKYLPV